MILDTPNESNPSSYECQDDYGCISPSCLGSPCWYSLISSSFCSTNFEKKEVIYYNVEEIADGLIKTELVNRAAVGGQVEIFLKNKKLGFGMVWEFNQKHTWVFALAGVGKFVTTECVVCLPIDLDGRTNSDLKINCCMLLFQGFARAQWAMQAINFNGLSLLPPHKGIAERRNVWRPLITGIRIIDFLFPIGLGQRQLIIGDRGTGKTTIALDSILSQFRTRIKCIYIAIGQKRSSVIKIGINFQKRRLFYVTILSADISMAAADQFLIAFSGCALAEMLSSANCDVLIVYDDLSKHAVAYRQMALLLRRAPGREAYPADIFYLHSGLLERAGQFLKGSITALPIIETLERDLSAFIPTNIISITDGQIFLDSTLVNDGVMPAVNINLSVSRIGSKCQYPYVRVMSRWLWKKISLYKKVEKLKSFSDDLDPNTKTEIEEGHRLMTFLSQGPGDPNDTFDEALLLSLAYKGFFRSVEEYGVRVFIAFFRNCLSEFMYVDKDYKLCAFHQKWYINFINTNFMNLSEFARFYCYSSFLWHKYDSFGHF